MKLFSTSPSEYSLRQRYVLAGLSGLSSVLVFQQNWWGLVAWVCLVPLFLALINAPRRHVWLLPWFFGFLWYYLGIWWLNTLVVFHVLAPLGAFGVAVFVGAYLLPLGWFVRSATRALPLWLVPFLVAAMWVAIEYSRTFLEIAFPWNFLAYSQVPVNLPFARTASIWGAGGVSFFIVLINAALAFSWNRRFSQDRHQLRITGIALAALVIVVIAVVTAAVMLPDESPSYRVSVAQPNLSQLEKMSTTQNWDALPDEEYTTRYRALETRMTQMAFGAIEEATSESAQLLVLPESTLLSSYFPYQNELHDTLVQEAKRRNLAIVLGADNLIAKDQYNIAAGTSVSLPQVPMKRSSDGTSYYAIEELPPMLFMVSAWAFTPDAGLLPAYDKSELVPFGERLPLLSFITPLQSFLENAGIAGAFVPGLEIRQFDLGGCRLGPTICFESTFAYVTREHARNDANALAVLTNDSWYDPQFAISNGGFWGTLFKMPLTAQMARLGPRQHLAQAQFRAMETGRPVFRSAISGISAIISPSGTIQSSIDYGESGLATADVTLTSRQTLYVLAGDWVALLCVLLTCTSAVAIYRRSRHSAVLNKADRLH